MEDLGDELQEADDEVDLDAELLGSPRVIDLDNELLERKKPIFDYSSEEGMDISDQEILRNSGFIR